MTTKYYEPGQRDGGNKGETASFFYVNEKKKENQTGRSIFMSSYCSYTDKKTENRGSRGCQKTKQTEKDSRRERQQMNIKLPC